MKILLAEDDPILRCLLEELLARWGHQPLVTEDGTAAVALVRQGEGFDVAILDWMMPGTSGPDVCRVIREVCRARRPYVLMLTAKSELEDVVDGLDAGADEYVTKPYRPTELAARLRAAQRQLEMQDELIAARQLVAYQSTHDLETGALNRGAFLNVLHELLEARREAPSPLSIVRLDVGARDVAQRIRVDDGLLKAVGERVQSSAPEGATLGRTSDTELLLLMPDADEEAAQELAESLTAGTRSLVLRTALGPVTTRADVCVVTARTRSELDLPWLLCAVVTLASVPGRSAELRLDAPGLAF